MLSENQMVRIKKAKESMYTGLCTVVEYRKVKNENKSTGFEEVTVLENIPCKLSFKNISSSIETDKASVINQSISLILAPEVKINPGSKIIVTQNKIITIYKNSGEPAVYSTHQEIILELFKGWS
ncbi:MAG TPA: hypothetical protein H9923_07425 [Candidatus Dwaynia gallinarum]|nr:hypothetical protein [Candidatus Dwaynia gallinarum]